MQRLRALLNTIAGYIEGLLNGHQFRQTAYALDRASRKAALGQYLSKASAAPQKINDADVPLAA